MRHDRPRDPRSQQFLAGPDANLRSGDQCPQCQAWLIVYKTSFDEVHCLRYIGCPVCGWTARGPQRLPIEIHPPGRSPRRPWTRRELSRIASKRCGELLRRGGGIAELLAASFNRSLSALRKRRSLLSNTRKMKPPTESKRQNWPLL